MTIDGYIVHSFLQNSHGRTRLCHVGRLADGRTFAVVENNQVPRYFVRSGELGSARRILGAAGDDWEATDFTTIDGEPVVRRRCRTARAAGGETQALAAAGIRHYEADLPLHEASLLDREIHGSVRISGESTDGRFVDLVFVDPMIEAGAWEPALSVLSIDIETNPQTDEVLAIGMAADDPWRERRPVVFVRTSDAGEGEPDQTFVADERELLERFVAAFSEFDPDLVTGWNVIDFDFGMIFRRLAVHGIPAALARGSMPARFMSADRDQTGRRQDAGVSMPGRQVIDGLRLLRYGPQRFDDRKLDSVAHAVLGEGKTVTRSTSREKIDTLLALHRDDPVAFGRYCLTDADLVIRILKKTGLLDLTLKRAQLTGIGISRAWTSIPGFEFLYIEALHRRGMVAPSSGVDPLPAGEAAGGAILTPIPGIHHDVLVFDFKSLYPSVIRTFNIDPAGYRGNEPGYNDGKTPPEDAPWLIAPNGARFDRGEAILPALIDRFWRERDAAKARGDDVGSYVYKIVMNSFYGVLGSSSCRFAGAALAGAITGFGQYLLHWSREWFTARGLRVLYGDTDSLFVHAAEVDGRALAAELNGELATFVTAHFRTESKLELEYEKHYRAFYLPRLRSLGPGRTDEVRGRAKGYAGLVDTGTPDGELEIKGMEAVRSDWTALAAQMQRGLLERVLGGRPVSEVEQFVRETISVMFAGQIDEKLVYEKRLRKAVDSYTKNRPPHVQAAMLLPPAEREGTIRYLLTTAGPQPVDHCTAKLDYEHYIEHQLRPIVAPVCELIGLTADDLLSTAGQLRLF